MVHTETPDEESRENTLADGGRTVELEGSKKSTGRYYIVQLPEFY